MVEKIYKETGLFRGLFLLLFLIDFKGQFDMMELTIDFVNTIYSGGVHAKENLPVLLTVALVFSSIFSPFFPYIIFRAMQR